MKIKLADIPINILDGLDKYPRVSIGLSSFLFGSLCASLWLGEFGVFTATCVGIFAGFVLAWYVGRP